MQISNGVFIFDELDKTCTDIYNSLLHIFDSTTNKHFRDEHFSDVELDLSRCKFITLVNNIQNIPIPLLNRMHVITVPGYTKSEKLEIAREYLIPRDIHPKIKIPPKVLEYIIEHTYDEGVRDVKKILQRIGMHSSLVIESPNSEYVLFSKFKLPYTLSINDVKSLM
jgi:ATP-dependent Lon protease